MTFSQGQHTTGVCRGGGLNHYQARAGDGKQRPLRSRCLPRLTRGVDMTSDVKGWEQLFSVGMLFFALHTSEEPEPVRIRRLILLLSVGCVPPSLYPSGACLIRGTRVLCGLVTLPRVTPNRGCASSNGVRNRDSFGCNTHSQLYTAGGTGTCLALAHMKARNSRAMATTT